MKNMTDAGVDRDTARAISGHRTDSIFSRYNIVDPQRHMDAASKIAARRDGRKTATNSATGEIQSVSS